MTSTGRVSKQRVRFSNHSNRYPDVWTLPTWDQLKLCIVGTCLVAFIYFIMVIPILPIVHHQAVITSQKNCTRKPAKAPPRLGRPQTASVFSYSPKRRDDLVTWPVTLDPECPSQNLFDIYSTPLTKEILTREINRAMWSTFRPRLGCPLSLFKSVGDTGENRKFMCGLKLLEDQDCLIYSFGLVKEAVFERNLIEAVPLCRIYLHDEHYPADLKLPKKIKLKRYGLWSKDEGSKRTLRSIFRTNAHYTREISLLKIEIGGGEFAVFNNIIKDFRKFLPVHQLLIKLQTPKEWNKKSFYEITALFKNLDRLGLQVYYSQIFNDEEGRTSAEFGLINLESTFWLEILDSIRPPANLTRIKRV